MWHKGDFRIIFRHERMPDQEKVEHALETMARRGSMEPAREAVARDTWVLSVAVLQKKITQDGLSAWATLGCGYSFCQLEDNFNKRKGRMLAFLRAVCQVKWDDYRQVFQDMWVENQPVKEDPPGVCNE